MSVLDKFLGKDEEKKEEQDTEEEEKKQDQEEEEDQETHKESREPSKVPESGSVIKEPIISEKSRRMSQDGKYVFLVDDSANKSSIKREVQDRWDVSVESVNTMRTETKAKKLAKRSGGQIVGGKSVKKKAIVTLSEGDSIDIFPV